MAEYYRTRFAIEGAVEDSELRGVALLEAAAGVAHEWAEDRFGEPLGDVAGNYKADNGAAVHIDRERLEESGFWGLTLEHPDRDTDGVRWRSDFRLATEGDRVDAEIDVSLRRVGGAPDSSNSLGNASYPNALATLFRKFVCKSAGEALTIRAKRIAASEAAAFVDDAIFSSERLMPLVVVSERWGRVLVDPDYLQWRLLGLATVATYDDAAAQAARERLGNSPIGCWGGYIRAYRPGCLPDDDLPGTPWRNRYWTWQEMLNIMRQNPEDLLRDIGDECLGLALPRPRPRMYEDVSSRIRRVRYERLLERAESASADVAENKALWELADGATRENGELRKNRDELLDQIDDLNSQLLDKEAVVKELNEALVAIQRTNADEPDAELGDLDEQPSEFVSVGNVVEYAKGTMDRLRFFSDAAEDDSYFPRPGDVYDALRALDKCAEERILGSLGMDVGDWLKGKGIDYAPHESDTAMGKYGDERTFQDDLRKTRVKMPAHIKLGGGVRGQNVLRIHLIWGEDAGCAEQKWLIGYIGTHLST